MMWKIACNLGMTVFFLLVGFTPVNSSRITFDPRDWQTSIEGFNHPQVVMWSPDGQYLAITDEQEAHFIVQIWGVEKHEVVASLEGTDYPPAMAWGPDAHFLAYSQDYDSVHIVDVASGELTLTLPALYVTSISWSPDQQIIAVAGSEDSEHRIVTSWNTKTGEWITSFQDNYQGVVGAAWSPDGSMIASSNRDASISLWASQNPTPFIILSGGGFYNIPPDFHTSQSLSWSPDGIHLATFANDNVLKSYVVRVWDITNKEMAAELKGHDNLISAVAWSPDGNMIAAGSYDKTVRIWDANTFELLAVLEGHLDFITSVSWNPDGTQLASASQDGSVRIWDVAAANN